MEDNFYFQYFKYLYLARSDYYLWIFFFYTFLFTVYYYISFSFLLCYSEIFFTSLASSSLTKYIAFWIFYRDFSCSNLMDIFLFFKLYTRAISELLSLFFKLFMEFTAIFFIITCSVNYLFFFIDYFYFCNCCLNVASLFLATITSCSSFLAYERFKWELGELGLDFIVGDTAFYFAYLVWLEIWFILLSYILYYVTIDIKCRKSKK